jgi:hypothetical protein
VAKGSVVTTCEGTNAYLVSWSAAPGYPAQVGNRGSRCESVAHVPPDRDRGTADHHLHCRRAHRASMTIIEDVGTTAETQDLKCPAT